MAVNLFAVTNRGLEAICAEEMRRSPGLSVRETGYRRVTAAAAPGSLSAALSLRTADDVFLDLGEWSSIGPHRAVLETIRAASRELDLRPVLETITRVRSVSRQPAFSVTANFVGRRNYSMDEIKAAVGEGVSERHGWRYVDEDQSEINLRVFIEHDRAYIGVRLGLTALHRRRYKQAHLPGSLKPTVAAAMLQTAELSPGMRLLDPVCGGATIAIEAALQGARAIGGDLEPEALSAARQNVLAAAVPVRLQRWDALRLPLPGGSVERVVANLPWGRQVQVDESLARFYSQAAAEMARVLAPGGRIVLLTSTPELVQLPGFELHTSVEISLFGQNPSILRYQR